MKKIISLLLALSMIFAFTLVFASCGGSNNDDSGSNENNETPAPKDPNKITEADWEAILATTNYTALDGEDSTRFYSTDGVVKRVTQDGTETYYIEQDGKVYVVTNGYGLNINMDLSLGFMMFSGTLDDAFDDMVYNEEGKYYSLSITDEDILSNGNYKFWFENGKLVKGFRERSGASAYIDFSDIGTTVIENVPEFEIISFGG